MGTELHEVDRYVDAPPEVVYRSYGSTRSAGVARRGRHARLDATSATALVCLGVVGVGLVTWLRRRLVVVTVSGESMTPTYGDGDRVLVRKAALPAIRPGHVVVIEAPDPDMRWVGPPAAGVVAGQDWIIKRAVAVPGDPLPRERVPVVAEWPEMYVPDGKLLVLGDNPDGSYDSRAFGYVPSQRVLGIVIRRFAVGR